MLYPPLDLQIRLLAAIRSNHLSSISDCDRERKKAVLGLIGSNGGERNRKRSEDREALQALFHPSFFVSRRHDDQKRSIALYASL
ncbi:hypothetical protein BVC80_9095g124 [Macleaya cordata]|uniref:Uncharacterized protein n=1 Tax=Macleaya cordata TaxID=56857 RepID=A0A200PXJ1_MACCD|nr:hypothetical protein BVC80_9095g124 [Macleaya cordata]